MKKAVGIRKFRNIHKKTPVLKSLLNKDLKIYYNETLIQMFSCEYCEIFLRIPTYFEEYLRTAASEVTLGSDFLGLSFWTVVFKTILSY